MQRKSPKPYLRSAVLNNEGINRQPEAHSLAYAADNRLSIQSLLQMKARMDAHTSKTPVAQMQAIANRVVQRGRSLKKSKELFEPDGDEGVRRRVTRFLSKEKQRERDRTRNLKNIRNFTTRNNFIVTLKYNRVKVSFHLLSAGLGGKHPMYQGRSASHTEQQWRAIYLSHSDHILNRVNSKLRARKRKEAKKIEDLSVESVWSFNEPCNSNPGDHKHGCGGIEVEDMGMDHDDKVYYTRKYQTGGKKEGLTKLQTLNKYSKGLDFDKDDESSDEELDGNKLRGKNIEEMKNKEFNKVFKFN